MSFNSIDYLIIFPVVVLTYFVFPKRIRMYWLLIVSYYFYMSWNARYGILLFFSTAVTWLCGLGLERAKGIAGEAKKKAWKLTVVFSSLIINLGLLFFFKYSGFIVNNINFFLSKIRCNVRCPGFDVVLPVGISFFIFQAVGYTIDVYRDEIRAEKNPFRYALFVSFFP